MCDKYEKCESVLFWCWSIVKVRVGSDYIYSFQDARHDMDMLIKLTLLIDTEIF